MAEVHLDYGIPRGYSISTAFPASVPVSSASSNIRGFADDGRSFREVGEDCEGFEDVALDGDLRF